MNVDALDLYDKVRLSRYDCDAMVIAIVRFKDSGKVRSIIVDYDYAHVREEDETLKRYIDDELDLAKHTVDYISEYLNYKNFGVAGRLVSELIQSGAAHRKKNHSPVVSDLGRWLSGIDKVKNHKPGNSGLEFL